MRNEKKLAYQEKMIQDLEEKVKGLEQENKALELENTSLKNINEVNCDTIEKLKAEQSEIQKEYNDGLIEIRELRRKYEEVIKSALCTQKEYENKMQVLLKKLRKQST